MSPLRLVRSDPATLQTFLDAPIDSHPFVTVAHVEVAAPTLVLGSTQGIVTVDQAAAARAGTQVVRRRSGGGAVLLVPGAATWLEVVMSRDDPRWDDDVGRSFHWLGEVFAGVLTGLGHDSVEVHRGPLVRSPWSAVACFAGLGPGEVTVSGRKAVGISQRRNRVGARFQCVVMGHHEPEALSALLRLEDQDHAALVDHLRATVTGVDGLDPGVLGDAVERAVSAPA
jgi:lipoate-protein ligase A